MPPKNLLKVKQEMEQRFLMTAYARAMTAESGTQKYGFENIVGVGISEKIIDGQLTPQQCVTVYVISKAPLSEIESEAQVPPTIQGMSTDVVATGEFKIFPYRGRYRPAAPGVSVGHQNITAGTLGCVVEKDRERYILSNNHVLADCNRGKKQADVILQPGRADGGNAPNDQIATLWDFVPIDFLGNPNQVDCAIAKIKSGVVLAVPKCFGPLKLPSQACRLNLLVKKCGRTTQWTRGRITDCQATVRVNFGNAGTALFQNQIVIQSLTPKPFSQGGDSGSLIATDDKNEPVGLLFGGTSSHTLANHIEPVLSALDVQIVT
jgi:hypothetical protein